MFAGLLHLRQLHLCNNQITTIPGEMFTVMFAMGRLPGWIAQWQEMRLRKEPIGRPRQIYTGETLRPFKSVNQR